MHHSIAHTVKLNNCPTLFIKEMPSMKTYNIKTNHSAFSLLACIAIQVLDMDPEIKCTHTSVAK